MSAIEHLISGENIKAFGGKLSSQKFVTDENRGEVMKFWGKRMLPQVFKWSDEEKKMIANDINEAEILTSASDFICSDLSLTSVTVEAGIVEVGRSASAIQLAPSIVYS